MFAQGPRRIVCFRSIELGATQRDPTVTHLEGAHIVSIRSGIVLGFATCGVYSGGARLDHIRSLETLKATDTPPAAREPRSGAARLTHAPERASLIGAAALTAGAATAVVITTVAPSGHMPRWSSLAHMGMLLTDRLLHLAVGDPFLVGSLLAILAVVAFAVLVTVVTCPADDASPASPRTLVGLRAGITVGGTARTPGLRPHRAGLRRLTVVTRRPPTLQTSHPATRPVTRNPVLGRTTR